MASDARQTYFTVDWLDPVKYPTWSWLRQTSDNITALCVLCKKKIHLSNMGIDAIKSHHARKVHQIKYNNKREDGTSLEGFLKIIPEAPVILPEQPNQKITIQPREGDISKFQKTADIIKSEIKWNLLAVTNHLSNRQAEKIQ